MANQVVIPVLISFVLSLVLGPVVIPFLRKLKMGQTERVEGVPVSYTHLAVPRARNFGFSSGAGTEEGVRNRSVRKGRA